MGLSSGGERGLGTKDRSRFLQIVPSKSGAAQMIAGEGRGLLGAWGASSQSIVVLDLAWASKKIAPL